MKIGKHKVVSFNYTLTDNNGEVIDSTEGQKSLAYIHGAGTLKAALENKMTGKQADDAFQVTVQPEDAYGIPDASLIKEVSRDLFGDIEQIEAGMQFQTKSGDVAEMVTVVAVGDKTVTVDCNHPLAGITLNFDIHVVDVRDATPEEMTHGHIHEQGDHQHK